MPNRKPVRESDDRPMIADGFGFTHSKEVPSRGGRQTRRRSRFRCTVPGTMHRNRTARTNRCSEIDQHCEGNTPSPALPGPRPMRAGDRLFHQRSAGRPARRSERSRVVGEILRHAAGQPSFLHHPVALVTFQHVFHRRIDVPPARGDEEPRSVGRTARYSSPVSSTTIEHPAWKHSQMNRSRVGKSISDPGEHVQTLVHLPEHVLVPDRPLGSWLRSQASILSCAAAERLRLADPAEARM